MSADASEFDEFHDVTHSGLWRTEAPDGSRRQICIAPIFRADWLSWRYRDEEGNCRPG
ncbi:MAG: hypothetical protein ACK47B_04695 [Armatimonadota bacterium]